MKKTCKKLVLGAASLALIGGLSPVFANNTYATSDFPLDFSETFYTTVGPDYFTYIDLYDYDNIDNVSVRVADTSIADRYYGKDGGRARRKVGKIVTDELLSIKATGAKDIAVPIPKSYNIPDFACSYNDLICIQGKKIGETELIITIDGDTTRVPLKSVKLTPEANNYGASGDTFTGTAAIEGADESLLSLEDYSSSDNVSIQIRGNRGTEYTVRSQKNIYGHHSGADFIWKIGEQMVGGGTIFNFVPVEIINNLDNSEETDAAIKNETLSLVASFGNYMRDIHEIQEYIRLDNYELDNGGVVNINLPFEALRTETGLIRTSLDLDNSSASASVKDKLSAKLPEKVNGTTFKNIRAKTEMCTISDDTSGDGGNITAQGIGGDETCYDFAEFVQFGEPLTVTLDASDAPALKSGYKRTYYVTIDNDGKIETVEGTYDAKNKTFTFSTNAIGDFAFGYVDEFVPVVPDTGMAPQKVAMVATATFAPLAVLAFIAFGIRNRKKASNKLAKKHNHFE